MLLAALAGGAQRRAGDEHPDRVRSVVVPVVAGHLPAGRVQPGEVLGPAPDRRSALEPVALAQGGMLATQPERALGDLVDVEPGVVGPPVDPGDLVVLAVGVVVATLGAAALVTGGDHRDAVGQAQRRHQVRGLPAAQRDDAGSSVSPSTPKFQERLLSVPSRLPSPLASLCLVVVAHQVAQREPVVRGDEVDRGVRRAAVVGVQVRWSRPAGWPRCGCRRAAAPEVADRVAELVVPLHPRRRELADPVAVHRGVPRLGDQLDVPQHRVLADRGEQVAAHVDAGRSG